MMKLLAFFLSLLFVVYSSLLFSGVNLKNGNFYISYADITVPGGGHDLKISRTYNSKATEDGWFGFGWGSPYETNLIVAADGSVIVHENGSGARTRFTPQTEIDATTAAKNIINAMKSKTTMSATVSDGLMKRLVGDAELRLEYAKKYNVKAKLAKGTILYSATRGLQEVHMLGDGFMRKFNDGKIEYFNLDGRLTKIKDKNGYEVDFDYKNGQLVSVKDSQAKQIFFSWYPNGKVKELWSVDDKRAKYKYSGNNLIESTDVGGHTYKYEYDGFHNLTAIKYADGTSKKIVYEKKTQFVSEIVDRNGESTKYQYGSNPKNPHNHYWTEVIKKGLGGKPITNKYEYEIKVRPDGSQYTYRILTVVNGVKTETIYSECCGLPLKISRGKNVTNFEYNKKGLLVKKTSSRGEFTELSYDDKLNKISRVVNNKGWTNFSYDKKGNLVTAENDKGQAVALIYDYQGRIVKMIDKQKEDKNKKRVLTFKYNALGKPVEISMVDVGTINVEYDNYGEIKKVESKAGHKMALQVTQAFQSLLSIVKPAGVNLNM